MDNTLSFTKPLLETPFHKRTFEACYNNDWYRWAGYKIAREYSNTELEYTSMRNTAGVLDITPMHKYDIKGKDAIKFVDKLVTRDVTQIKPNQVMYIIWCNEDGNVIDDGTVFCFDKNHLRIFCAERNLNWFSDTAIGFDVEVKDVSDSIAALAFGTESIKSVNKIFGPGNAYVASAKKQVFGDVGIDLIAGPSEIVVVADSKNDPKWVASDLIAQAEHDEKAQSILITDNKNFANKVLSSIKDLITNLPKKNTIKKSLNKYGLIILVDDFKNCHNIINNIAPEHLHLQNKDRNKICKKVINAGAIFLGKYSSEVFGDYIVGTNHILPTSGAAKFSSGLGVLDFMKRTSIVEMNFSGYQKYASKVAKMANIENLEGHKLSVKIRQNDKK